MEVHFTPEQEAQLSQIAAKVGTDAENLVKDAAVRLLEENARLVEAVKRGEDALDRGEYLTHEQVGERLRRYLQQQITFRPRNRFCEACNDPFTDR